MGYYVCEIYKDRPEMCKKYPERDSYIPESCTFYWTDDGTRKGSCDPECKAACCRLPRHQGEPVGPGLPEIAGGLPCKYLEYTDSHPGLKDGGDSSPSVGDREEDRQGSSPLELALAEINSRKGNLSRTQEVGPGGRTGGGG